MSVAAASAGRSLWRRLEAGASLKHLVDEGVVTEDDLNDLDDDPDAPDTELAALKERARRVRQDRKAQIALEIEARQREREPRLQRTAEEVWNVLSKLPQYEQSRRAAAAFEKWCAAQPERTTVERLAAVERIAAMPEPTLEEVCAEQQREIVALDAAAKANGRVLDPIDAFLARLTADQLRVFMCKSAPKFEPGELDAFLAAASRLTDEKLNAFLWTCRRVSAAEIEAFLASAPSKPVAEPGEIAEEQQVAEPIAQRQGPPADVIDDLPTDAPRYPWDQIAGQSADAEALAQVMHAPTEDNVALLFEQQAHTLFRYCLGWGCWLVWDGARWHAEKTDAALDFCRALARKVNTQGKTSIARAGFARGVESLARAARRFATVPEQWDCDEFALNTPAGIVDLRTGSIRPHSGREYVTRVTRVAPQPGPRPVFERFMRQITLDNEALIAYHQRSLGATLSGARADHWLLFWIGAGRNGKNTLGELVEWILGDYAKTIPTETLMSAQHEQRHPTELANLRALRLAISSEVPEGAYWNESRIKSLTGDASISARYMRQDFFEFPRGHKHLVYGNHRPLLRVVDDAIKARMHVVPFKAMFTDELRNRDPLLPRKLRAEAPAIFSWLIDGHLQWIADGYTLPKPEAVKRETEDYFESQSTPDLWIAERCERVPNDERPSGALDKAGALYASFRAWKEARGEHPMSTTRWGEWMGSRFVKVRADGWRYRGLRLKTEPATEPYWR